MIETEAWRSELWELVRKLKMHVVTVEQYNAERRQLSRKAPNQRAFDEEEQRLFTVPLDVEASAEVINARAEGPPYVVPKPEENDECGGNKLLKGRLI
jgi:hypothetical protein